MSSQADRVMYCQRVRKCDPQRGKGIEKGPGVGSLLCTDVNLKIRHICKLINSSYLYFWKGDVIWIIETSR